MHLRQAWEGTEAGRWDEEAVSFKELLRRNGEGMTVPPELRGCTHCTMEVAEENGVTVRRTAELESSLPHVTASCHYRACRAPPPVTVPHAGFARI